MKFQLESFWSLRTGWQTDRYDEANSCFSSVVLRRRLKVMRAASHFANKWHMPCLLTCRWRGPTGDMTGVRSLLSCLVWRARMSCCCIPQQLGSPQTGSSRWWVVLHTSLIPKLGPLLWAAFGTTHCSSSCCPCVSDLCAKSLRSVTAQWAGQPRYNSWRQVGQFGSINNATGSFTGFSQFLQASASMIPQLGHDFFSSTFFQIHYSQTLPLLDTV
jgi:hypothetical protein